MPKKNCCICNTQTSSRWYTSDSLGSDVIIKSFELSEKREGFLCSSCRNDVVRSKKSNHRLAYPQKVNSRGHKCLKSSKLRKIESAKSLHLASFKTLSRELILYIFKFLGINSLINLSLVSKKFNECCNDSNLWHEKCKSDFNYTQDIEVLVEMSNTHWKMVYRIMKEQHNNCNENLGEGSHHHIP